jgi:DNA-binding SARP family transcriptional activator
VELYVGPFLIEYYSEWVEVRRRELENSYLKILSQLADIHIKKGNVERAVTLLEKSIAIDPYQEEIYYRIMRLHLARRNKMLALRVYRQFLNEIGDNIKQDTALKIQELLR